MKLKNMNDMLYLLYSKNVKFFLLFYFHNTCLISMKSLLMVLITWKIYDNFLNNLPQSSNQKLCDVRASFEKYNLISGLHTLMSQKNSIFVIFSSKIALSIRVLAPT